MVNDLNQTNEERWSVIEGFSDYAISSMGRVMSLRYDRVLATRPNSYGHHRVILYSDREPKDVYVHHLVASAFTTGYSAGMQVRHRDGNNGNNQVENLRFPGRGLGQLVKNPPPARPRRVRIVELDTTFRNVEECAAYLGGDSSSIYRVLRGERRSHRGYTFEYVEVLDGFA